MTLAADAAAVQIAAAVRSRRIGAEQIARAALARIDDLDRRCNCFTAVTRERALARAARIDADVAAGRPVGPLAGVPFAVKNLFDIAGLATLAGSKIGREAPPASRDAALIERLEHAGAVLLGALNMDEYAYGFTTENAHFGPTRNPHDVERVAGGSSGGSAAAVAAGMVPLTLGSDTNGSIRVPASFCGVFGLKPTYGRLSRRGALLFAASFDHLGPFARSARDLALAYDAMQGRDAEDPAQVERPVEPALTGIDHGASGLRIAVADGYFHEQAAPAARAALACAAEALGATRRVTIPEAQRARAAAYVITMAEGANLHLPNLRTRPLDFDFATRDRFLAGCLVPATYVQQAQRFRRWYRREVLRLFEDVDVILAPATPVAATKIGQATIELNGTSLPARASLGLLTQPLSFIGLPIVAAPIARPGALPLGVQIIAAPWREDLALRAAHALERAGVAAAPLAQAAVRC